ncbi:iron export ABC transporter permease subunit FetB [Clostridiaceae bacterium DONG20-135]|uniref:Iron export ABC transporter permease subunit FetB n=1 Tax=Copranaerobaculum intestinale TaxID=2692629 RepID=A0A6N8U4M8_9FIRM|nr:iron export ABC transporter permease subunit FetB [Copranaerobaculum intestinale]MXQ73158.1 iron export ABC transporter permease subunit FetB [Copranaerobaculum intestinale]
MKDHVMDLSILQLAIAYIFVLLLLIVFRKRGIRREKQILIAATRMTVQLTFMGYILMYVFHNPSWWLTSLMILVMVSFAVFNSWKRVKEPLGRELKQIMAIALIAGSLIIAVLFILLILQVKPWFDPQYFIPISGMIIGNAMTGISLGANKLCWEMKTQRERIENSLMLGAEPHDAVHQIVNDAFDSAILPTMNNMLTMGIVSLPGMMTGQILSGTVPLTAIRYQIGIMLAILGSTTLTVVIFVILGYRTFFTKSKQLKSQSQE